MSKLGAFYGSKLGLFRGSKLGARGRAICPDAINLTVAGVDAAPVCSNIKTGFGLDCSSPFFCMTGVSSSVDGVYYLPRYGAANELACTWRAVFDAPATFTKGNWSGTCIGTPTTINTPKILVIATTNVDGAIEEVVISPLDSGGVNNPGGSTYIAYYSRLFNGSIPFATSQAFADCAYIPTLQAAHQGCAILMGGGTFQADEP